MENEQNDYIYNIEKDCFVKKEDFLMNNENRDIYLNIDNIKKETNHG